MTTETWRRVRSLVEDALDLPLERVPGYLDLFCEPALRGEVESLLEAARQPHSWLDEPALIVEPTAPAGTRVGHYVIQEPVGHGGMGVVYRAWDPHLGRMVALKVLSVPMGDPALLTEARTASALSHPNIVVIHDVLAYRGSPAMVMELVEGRTLSDLLAAGPMPLEQARHVAAQIASAMVASHKAGVLHRDLKPSNIMIRPDGVVKVLDFGIARRLNDRGGAIAAGTAGYMAPEQEAGEAGDERSDIYAFGALLSAMIPAKPPRHWRALMQRCLAKRPEARVPSMRQVLAVLCPAPPPWRGKAMVVAGVLPMALWAAWTWFGRAEPGGPAVRFEFAPPDGGAIDQASGVVSPDGKSLAFAAVVNGKRALWVRALDGRKARQLAGTDGAQGPFWSPDSRNLSYIADARLRRIPAAGGESREICNELSTLGAFWGRDGQIVYSRAAGGLRRVSAAGGIPEALTELDAARAEISHRSPQPLPNGSILFHAVSSRAGESGLEMIAPARPRQRRRLMPSDGGALYTQGHLVWRRGDALVALPVDLERGQIGKGEPRVVAEVANPDAVSRVVLSTPENQSAIVIGTVLYTDRLTWFDRTGRRLRAFGPPRRQSYFALSRDGREVVVAIGSANGSFDLWLVDVERDAWKRLTFGAGGSNNYPVWSPDGHRTS